MAPKRKAASEAAAEKAPAATKLAKREQAPAPSSASEKGIIIEAWCVRDLVFVVRYEPTDLRFAFHAVRAEAHSRHGEPQSENDMDLKDKRSMHWFCALKVVLNTRFLLAS